MRLLLAVVGAAVAAGAAFILGYLSGEWRGWDAAVEWEEARHADPR